MIIGRKIGKYEILEKLGEGGMGEVYLAEDSRLRRKVALKFLPAYLTADKEAVRRFEHEAQATAALNHPNIITIHDIGDFEGQTYICMEYAEGQSLADLLKGGAVPVTRATDIALQIAEGLKRAHETGIIHRDIKPANVLVDRQGGVKILDFGVAKLKGVTKLTKDTSSVGTIEYMSPEQLQGLAVDHRTDIWSLGVVLYEMLSGKPPFAGDYDQSVAYAIINKKAPALADAASDIPRSLQQIVERAMAQDPEDRYQSAGDLAEELCTFRAMTETSVPIQARQRRKSLTTRRAVLFAAVVAIVVGAYIVQQRSRNKTASVTEQPEGQTLSQTTLKQATFLEALEEYPAFSPDGKQLAYCADTDGYKHVFVKSLETGDERQLTTGRHDDIQTAWSPDGETILFVRSHRADGKMQPADVFGVYSDGDVWKLVLSTAKETRMLENAFNPAFSPGGDRIAFDASWAGNRRIWVADSLGRNAQQLTSVGPEGVSHIVPSWSPDGTKITFQNTEWTKYDIKAIDVSTHEMWALTDDAYQDLNPVWSPRGDAVYFSSYRSGGLNVWRVPVSADGRPDDIPRQVTVGAGQDVQLAFSRDGAMLAFSSLKLNADIWRLPVSPETGQPTGHPEPVNATTREDSRGAWSGDGKAIAFNSDRGGDMNIWVYTFADGATRQITTGHGGDYQPNWSPDGRQIAFFSARSGNADIWTVDLGTGKLKRLTSNPSLDINPFFSPDGKYIAYQASQRGRKELWVMDATGDEKRQLTTISVSGHFVRWSPDGSFIYFNSSGIKKVPFDGGDPVPLPDIKGGSHISFSPMNDVVIDVVGHAKIWASPVGAGIPVEIFSFDDPDVRIDYPVWSPDGHWLLFDRVKPQGGDIWLIENFE